VVAVELASGAVPLFEAPLDGDVCLAIGNEDHGCSPALLPRSRRPPISSGRPGRLA